MSCLSITPTLFGYLWKVLKAYLKRSCPCMLRLHDMGEKKHWLHFALKLKQKNPSFTGPCCLFGSHRWLKGLKMPVSSVVVNQRGCLIIIYSTYVCWSCIYLCVCVFIFRTICSGSEQLGIDLCECVCVCIMVMPRCVDFHVRQQHSLLTSLLPILSCVCALVCACAHLWYLT